MKKILFIVFVVFCLSIISTHNAQCQFKSLETENFRLIYFGELQSFLIPHVGRCFENSYRFHRQLWDYQSPEKITILLYDLSDYGNAGAGSIPWNIVSVSIAPHNYTFETVPANERVNWVMNHELVHIVALDKTTGSDRFFRSLFFGKVAATAENPETFLYSYLTSPRRSAPVWYHEGIAVFMETWMAGGLGRALGAYDEMIFRTLVGDSSRFYDAVGLESEGTKIDFQLGVNSYLYGTRFHSYLALKHGPESILNWVNRTEDSKSYFLSQFKKVYGVSLDEEWDRWIAWEKQFQQSNLDTIRMYPVTGHRDVSQKALGSVSRMYYNPDENVLYAAVNYPGQIAHIASIDLETGEMDKICDIKGAALYNVTSLAYDPVSGTLFYTTDNYDWRDIISIDLNSGKSATLLKDARVGDLAFNASDSSLWGVRHFNGISTLVRIPYPYERWNQIYSWPYGKDIYDIDISPDGLYLAAALAEISGRQTLITMTIDGLMSGDTTYTTVFDFGNSNPANFTYSSDGNYLYGSSYYTGVSNIFRYDIARDSMEAITNCETGYFRPLPVSEDSIAAICYAGNGFKPVMIKNEVIEDINPIRFLGQEVVKKYPKVKEWLMGSPMTIDLDTMVVDSGDYRGLTSMQLASAYPIVEGYRHYTAVGMKLNFSDPVGFYTSDLSVSYTPSVGVPDDERWHGRFSFSHFDWSLNFRHNAADFYDLFGPTKTSRKGNSLGLQYEKTLIYDEPRTLRYNINITGYWGLRRLPDYQNVVASYDKFLSLGGKIVYSNPRASLGAVDYEKGFKFDLAGNDTYVNEKHYPRIYANFDYGLPLPIGHSSIWLRHSAGSAFGERFEPFANFYFGGFGNNWVDYLSIKRYRQYYSFPGIELNEIGGKNFGKLILEWNLPPVRFRHIGFPVFYFSWIRTSVFSSLLSTNVDSDEYRRVIGNVGAQIDLRMQLLSHLRLTFSVGYAAAFEDYEYISDEFMLSLKIL
jgi:hypothetical protein